MARRNVFWPYPPRRPVSGQRPGSTKVAGQIFSWRSILADADRSCQGFVPVCRQQTADRHLLVTWKRRNTVASGDECFLFLTLTAGLVDSRPGFTPSTRACPPTEMSEVRPAELFPFSLKKKRNIRWACPRHL